MVITSLQSDNQKYVCVQRLGKCEGKKNYAAWKNINFAYTDRLNGME